MTCDVMMKYETPRVPGHMSQQPGHGGGWMPIEFEPNDDR